MEISLGAEVGEVAGVFWQPNKAEAKKKPAANFTGYFMGYLVSECEYAKFTAQLT